MSTSTNQLTINFVPNDFSVHPDEVVGIYDLRRTHDCVWMDRAGIEKFNPVLQVLDSPNDHKVQPLRLVWIDLKSINFDHAVFCDQWKRNTMVLASDSDVRENQDIAFELDKRGIALLMSGPDEKNPLPSVLKSLASLKFKSILVEGTAKSIFLFKNI
jgi:riboflavin biosynthesis pyrimidine reductase